MAQTLKREAATARQFKEKPDDPRIARLERSHGKEFFDMLKASDPTAIEKRSEEYFERVVKEFDDVKGQRNSELGKLAEGELFDLRHLAVGKVAPEIEGEDTDGKPTKLTDYRGKVVLLDFWGHW